MDEKKLAKASSAKVTDNKASVTSSLANTVTASVKTKPNDEDFYLNNDDDDEDNYEDEDLEEDDDDNGDYDDYMDDTDDLEYANTSNPKYDQTPSVNIQNKIEPTSQAPNSSSYTSTSLKNTSSLSQSANQSNDLSKSLSKRTQVELDDEFKYEVLTPDKIVQHMIECIKNVNQVLELTPTTTRILLHHFRWDKEKLMERFYDGDQDRLFKEAHVVSPFKAGGQRKVFSF